MLDKMWICDFGNTAAASDDTCKIMMGCVSGSISWFRLMITNFHSLLCDMKGKIMMGCTSGSMSCTIIFGISCDYLFILYCVLFSHAVTLPCIVKVS